MSQATSQVLAASKRFGWGVIGPGKIARRFAQAFSALPEARIAAVASASPARAQAYAAEFGIERSYADYRALIDDPAVDAVYIASLHHQHVEAIRLCLEAGKPVLCEKPLTVNAAQARTVIELSRSTGVFLMEALWSRFLPIYGVVRKWLDEGEIGKPELMYSSFGFNIPRDPSDRMLNPALSGGVLLDMGIYNLSIAQWVLRENPVSVVATGLIGETGVDERVLGTLQYPGGTMAQFHCNFRTTTVNDFRIAGPGGEIRIHPWFWDTRSATLSQWGRDLTAHAEYEASGFEYQIREAMRCIAEGRIESPGITHAETLATLELMDTIRAQIGLIYPFERQEAMAA